MKYIPFPYQTHAYDHVIDHSGAGLLLDMGLGKTVIVLTAIDELKFNRFEVKKALVIAPKRVAESTWTGEARKWDHLKHLKVSMILGAEKARKEAIRAKADVYVINRENVPWLVAQCGSAWPFDMVIVDESTSFKNPKAIRFKALRQVRPLVKRVVILTGTPVPNSLLDFWSQVYLLDMGVRLGKTIGIFRDKYFVPAQTNGHAVLSYKQKLTKSEKEFLGEDIYLKEVFEKVGDICISMTADDYLDLPPLIERDIVLHFDAKQQKEYDDFERTEVLALAKKYEGEQDIVALNAAALSMKLLQYANGAVYNDSRGVYQAHTVTLDALEEVVENLNGSPIFVMYNFQHDRDRILKHLSGYKPRVLMGPKDIEDWNNGRIPVLLGQPKSTAYGLNLQAGGHNLGLFGLTWSAEEHLQFIKRVHRQGQTKPVISHRFRVHGTMHDDVCEAIERKIGVNDACMAAVKARFDKWL